MISAELSLQSFNTLNELAPYRDNRPRHLRLDVILKIANCVRLRDDDEVFIASTKSVKGIFDTGLRWG